MLCDWYKVSFDAEKIYRNVSAPAMPEAPDSDVISTPTPWADSLQWTDIIKVCFEANGGLEPDAIYLFTSTRTESYAIPMEAAGAAELWDEIIKRKLFDATLAIEAATALSGLFCSPQDGILSASIPDFQNNTSSHTFPVHITDHANYQDDDGEYIQGEYDTLEEAQKVCKNIIDSELAALHTPGMSAEDLQKQFLMFGQEAWCEGFSGMEYAKLRCAELGHL